MPPNLNLKSVTVSNASQESHCVFLWDYSSWWQPNFAQKKVSVPSILFYCNSFLKLGSVHYTWKTERLNTVKACTLCRPTCLIKKKKMFTLRNILTTNLSIQYVFFFSTGHQLCTAVVENLVISSSRWSSSLIPDKTILQYLFYFCSDTLNTV